MGHYTVTKWCLTIQQLLVPIQQVLVPILSIPTRFAMVLGWFGAQTRGSTARLVSNFVRDRAPSVLLRSS